MQSMARLSGIVAGLGSRLVWMAAEIGSNRLPLWSEIVVSSCTACTIVGLRSEAASEKHDQAETARKGGEALDVSDDRELPVRPSVVESECAEHLLGHAHKHSDRRPANAGEP